MSALNAKYLATYNSESAFVSLVEDMSLLKYQIQQNYLTEEKLIGMLYRHIA